MNQDDNSIPLLTEVIPLAPAAPAHAPGRAPDYAPPARPGAFHTQPAATSYQATPPGAPIVAPLPVTPAAEQYRQWEQEIRENVLQSLLEQVDTVLQQQLQDQMALVLDNLSTVLTQRIKDSLHEALAETVTRAVAEEMARFASTKS
ncbi:hypothetical protein [Herbaspirillum seropedicae]|uniref:hypothetical protein n=1 Tax=Herbaspirillum seropedicae TaxID=964 RepID=UPI003FCC2877